MKKSKEVMAPKIVEAFIEMEMLEFSFKIWMLDWISWSSQTSRSPVRERGWSAKLHFRTVDFSDCADGGLGGLPKLIQAGPE